MSSAKNPFEFEAPQHLFVSENLQELASPFVSGEFLNLLVFDRKPPDICIFTAHWHQRMEFLRIREGTLYLYMNESRMYSLTPGSMAIICPNQVHRGISGDEHVTYDILALDLNPFLGNIPGVSPVLRHLADSRTVFDPVCTAPSVLQALDSAIAAAPVGGLEAAGHCCLLLAQLFQHCNPNENRLNTAAKQFRGLIEYVNQHFLDPLTTDSVSTKFGYTKSYFCTRFKSITGLTFQRYVEILRLERAGILLQQTDASIANIALQCAFSDADYFSTRFRKHYGITPSEMRRQAGK